MVTQSRQFYPNKIRLLNGRAHSKKKEKRKLWKENSGNIKFQYFSQVGGWEALSAQAKFFASKENSICSNDRVWRTYFRPPSPAEI